MQFQRGIPVLLVLLGCLVSPAPGRAQTLTVLYHLGTNPADPTFPQRIGTLVEGKDGSLYSATEQGGAQGKGAIFKITPEGKLTVLHSFDGAHDGASPDGGVSLGSDGALYGTCYGGGAQGVGTLWKITPGGAFTLLHSLLPNDGSYPTSVPVQGKDGQFYGVTSYTNNFQLGVVYKLTPTGGYVPLYKFNGKDMAAIGIFASSLVAASDGNFYGTTYKGGTGYGSVYKVTPGGSVSALHLFDHTHGSASANLMQASDGHLYGTCSAGGPANYGLIYKLTLTGEYTVLHTFTGPDGACPFGGLAQGKDGYLYGATKFGGTPNRGVIYRIKPSGQEFKVLYTRNGNMSVGMYCLQTPVLHSDGNLYGVTYQGGSKGGGVFYKLDLHTITLTPPSGKAGTTVRITGVGFTGATKVTFNGTAATFKVTSDTDLTATVPAGATTGPVKVVTPKGTLSSTKAFQAL